MIEVIQLKYFKAKYEKVMCPVYNKLYNPNVVISKWCVGFNMHKNPRIKTHFTTCPLNFLPVFMKPLLWILFPSN